MRKNSMFMRNLTITYLISTLGLNISQSVLVTNATTLETTISSETNEEIKEVVSEITLESMKNQYNSMIKDLNEQKYQVQTTEELEGIEQQIETYNTMLDILDDYSEADIDEGKNIVIKALNGIEEKGALTNATISATITTIIHTGRLMGYEAAALLLEQSFTLKKPNVTITYANISNICQRIKSTSDYRNIVKDIQSKYNSQSSKNYRYTNNSFEFKGGSNTVDKDLYYAIHGCNGGMEANIIDSAYALSSSNGVLTFRDYYDFPDLSWGLDVTTTLNNIGKIAMDRKIIKPFYVVCNVNENFNRSVSSGSSNTTPSTGSSSSSNSSSNSTSGYSRLLQIKNPLMYGNDIKQVQNKLNSLGYNVGAADGYYGNMTKQAVINFQKNNGLVADGIVGQATWNKLFSSTGNSATTSILEDLAFDYKFYADKYIDLKNAYGYNEALLKEHWKTYGIKEGRTASPVLDLKYYLSNNVDLRNAYGQDYTKVYKHYLEYGANEGRALSPVYHGVYYRNNHIDLQSFNGIDLLKHFVSYGMNEGRVASSNFNFTNYKNRYADLRNTYGNNNKKYYEHYIIYGIPEGRNGK